MNHVGEDGSRNGSVEPIISDVELTILMPCLNEHETVATCVRKARGFLEETGIVGEVLVADNGSTDDSPSLAAAAGARVVSVAGRGYGAALSGGIRAARGRFVIMGDADDSYDFSDLLPFVERLRLGDDLVMGNRFAGGIDPGAMPWLHRWIGNPVLSWIGRLFFRIPVRDFHCGLRGFRRDRVLSLGLHTTGMEWASELVVSSALAGFAISEVPTTLSPDGRSGRPHLRSFHDGWRHLRFLLLYSPRWLFLYPGLTALIGGLVGALRLIIGPVAIGQFGVDVGALMFMAALAILGYQSVWFAILTKRLGEKQGFLPAGRQFSFVSDALTLERGLVLGFLLMLVGSGAALLSFARWSNAGFGELDSGQTVRTVVPAMLGLVLGAQTIFASLYWSILGIDVTKANEPLGEASQRT